MYGEVQPVRGRFAETTSSIEQAARKVTPEATIKGSHV
jgi:hypothetical protein